MAIARFFALHAKTKKKQKRWFIFLLTLICIKWVPRDPSTIFLANIFTQKKARKLRFYVLLHFNARKYDIIILPEVDQIYKKLWICSNLIRVPGDSQLEQNSQLLVNSVYFR